MKTNTLHHLSAFIIFLFSSLSVISQTEVFNYKKYILGSPGTLNLFLVDLNRVTGDISINGGDSSAPGIPFTWIWGDNTKNEGWFPQSHKYTNITKNYVVSVVAHYSGNKTDTVELLVTFLKPGANPVALNTDLRVSIPSQTTNLVTRLYTLSPTLSYFSDDFFTTYSRSTVEYILSVFASIDYDLVNNDVFLFNNKFEEVMLRDAAFNGAYSMWFTNPVSFGVGDVFMSGDIDFQSLCHEMGHNFTLNTPSSFYYGGKIDGNANAIYSESLAQIFSHSTGYEILNKYQNYGISYDLMLKLREKFTNSIKFVRDCYEKYLAGGKHFRTFNYPFVSQGETFYTFMTIAYKFFEHAEMDKRGYKTPLKRMMQTLQKFNGSFQNLYDPQNNTLKADTFRATLLVASLSNAFQSDLRNEFRMLNFPVSNPYFNLFDPKLLEISADSLTVAHSAGSKATFNISSTTNWSVASSAAWLILDAVTGTGNSAVVLTASANPDTTIRLAELTVSGSGVNPLIIKVAQGKGLTGIVEMNKNQDIRIFPNPTRDILYFSPASDVSSAAIYDSNGKLIFSYRINSNKVNISRLPDGMYTIHLNRNGKTLSKKFIKVH